MSEKEPSGVLVVDKPAGPTSFDVVERVRRALRASKAGHAGTLDPAATGVLAICVGDAVKLQQYLAGGDKSYQATVAFGAATDTEDGAGKVTARGDPSGLTAAAIRGALPGLVGDIEQVPPMFSAVRVGGRRLHAAARAGEHVERAPRRVCVHALELVELEPAAGGVALAHISVRCGKGTYVRTLAADLGRAVGVPAHLSALRRTGAGPFGLDEALGLAEIEALALRDRAALAARLLPLSEALRGFPTVRLDARGTADLVHGRALSIPDAPQGLCRALDPAGALVAVCEGTGGALRPVRVLARPSH